MISIRTFVLTLALLHVFPAIVFAASGGEESGWGWFDPVGRWTNLAILGGVIGFFLRKPLMQFLESRRATIQKEIQEALEAKEQAEAKLAAMEERIKNLDAELEVIRKEADAAAEQERLRILEEGEKDAAKAKEAALRQIGGMTSLAKQELKAYASELSIELARKQIEKEMDSRSERRIIDRFLVEVAGIKEGSK